MIGRKIGMTQILKEDGSVVPVSIVEAGPVTVTAVKTTETDGYDAVQLGFGNAKKLSKPVAGHVKKANVMPTVIKEFRGQFDEAQVGASFDVTVFEVGESVKVSGKSKGKGFAGTVKRHNFNTGPKTHGSRNYRRPGSIGSMYPQKIFKGKKMAGQMGGDNMSLVNQKVAYIDQEKNLIGILGGVPGPKGSIVVIETTTR
jgi:large subunit ribosomal protein L3